MTKQIDVVICVNKHKHQEGSLSGTCEIQKW